MCGSVFSGMGRNKWLLVEQKVNDLRWNDEYFGFIFFPFVVCVSAPKVKCFFVFNELDETGKSY